MKVSVHFHGILADWVGTPTAILELSDTAVYGDLTGEIRRRFGGNMPDQLWDDEKNEFHKKVRAFRAGKALDPADFKLRHGDRLTFYLMMAGG
jgi:hypothetical protein